MENTPFKIYRDGQLSRLETYTPVLRVKLTQLGNKIDYLFVNGSWPRQ